MMLKENNTQPGNDHSLKHAGATPRQLVQHQIENYDYHVTDEDIENMIISTELSENEKGESHEQADSSQKNNAGSSYEVMDK